MNCLLTELCADHVRTELLELKTQRTDADRGRKLICLLVVLHAVDLAGSARNCIADHRVRIRSAVVDNGNVLADQLARRIGKGLRPFLGEIEFHEILALPRGLVLHLCRLCALHLIAGQNDRTGRIHKGQRTRTTEIFQNLVRIGDTRNVDINTIPALLIDLRLGGVILHALLELEDGVLHVLRARILLLRLVGDADTAREIQTELNLIAAHTVVCEI